MRKPDKAVLLITHYQRLLDIVEPDFVHVLAGGRIVRSGGPELAHAARARRLWRMADGGRDACSIFPRQPRTEGWRWSDLSALPALAEARADRARCRTRCPGSTASRGPAAAVRRRPARRGPQPLGPVDDRRRRRSRPAIRSAAWPAGPAGRCGSAATMRRPASSRSSTSRPAPPIISPPRSCSTTDAQASIVETFVGEGWANRLTGIALGKGARLMLSRPDARRRRGFVSLTDQRRGRRRREPRRRRRSPPAARDTPARRRDRPRRRGRLCRGRRRPARARPPAA